ncbi:MAG: DUF6763 family protein [Acidiferrobacterales bacterium]
MAIPKKPRLDSWYLDEEGRRFKIVAIDEGDGAIEIQYFDGDVTEVESDTWYQRDLQLIEEPEDGTGPFDDFDQDYNGATYRALNPEDRNGLSDEEDLEE